MEGSVESPWPGHAFDGSSPDLFDDNAAGHMSKGSQDAEGPVRVAAQLPMQEIITLTN